MGEGDQVCEYQAVVIPSAPFITCCQTNVAFVSQPIPTASEPLAMQIYAPESRLLVDLSKKSQV